MQTGDSLAVCSCSLTLQLNPIERFWAAFKFFARDNTAKENATPRPSEQNQHPWCTGSSAG